MNLRKMRWTGATIMGLWLLGVAAASAQTTWFVDDDAPHDPGPGDPTISDPLEDGSAAHPFDAVQEAIDAAAAGDEVLLADGVFTGVGNRELNPLGKDITIRSANGDAAACVIDCEMETYGFLINTGETTDLLIADLTITHGVGLHMGGGISCYDGGVTIQNCRLIANRNNDDHSTGGGIRGNHADLVVVDCLIAENAAGNGAGIGAYGGDVVIEGCTLRDNQAVFYGGGAHLSGDSTDVSDCLIENNLAESGAGIVAGTIFGAGMVRNCRIVENHAPIGFGAIRADTVVNCLIVGNRSGSDRSVGVARHTVNCTIVGNHGGSYSALNSETVTNCIVWDNGPDPIDAGAVVSHSVVEGGFPGVEVISEDPGLAFDSDYHLSSTSPCIDAGTDAPIGGAPETDLDGNPRPLATDGVMDIGAYEFNIAAPSIAVSQRTPLLAQPLDIGVNPSLVLGIRNAGGQTLNWKILGGCPWLTCSSTIGSSSGEIDDVTLEFDTTGLGHGDHVCELTLSAPNAMNNPVPITVTLRLTDTLEVPQMYATIGAAVEAAVDGDRIVIADGTYAGPGNCDVDVGGRRVLIRSVSGDPEQCVVDCSGADFGFAFRSGEGPETELSGLTIANSHGDGILTGRVSSPTLRDCHVVNSESSGIVVGDFCDPHVTRCVVRGSADRGAVVGSRSRPVFDRCVFQDNAQGGIDVALYCTCYSGRLPIAHVNDCLFTGNSAMWGGAIHTWNGASFFINRSTFFGNSAEERGGAVEAGWFLDIRNSIFWGNAAPDGAEISSRYYFEMAHCDVEGGEDGFSLFGYQPVVEGLMDADPLFVDPAGGDFHLQPGSPCIDAGDPAFVADPKAVRDIDEEPRIMGCRLDMGADEFTAGEPSSGDLDGNGEVELPDIPLFVTVLLGDGASMDVCVADLDGSGVADGRDVHLFMDQLLDL